MPKKGHHSRPVGGDNPCVIRPGSGVLIFNFVKFCFGLNTELKHWTLFSKKLNIAWLASEKPWFIFIYIYIFKFSGFHSFQETWKIIQYLSSMFEVFWCTTWLFLKKNIFKLYYRGYQTLKSKYTRNRPYSGSAVLKNRVLKKRSLKNRSTQKTQ